MSALDHEAGARALFEASVRRRGSTVVRWDLADETTRQSWRDAFADTLAEIDRQRAAAPVADVAGLLKEAGRYKGNTSAEVLLRKLARALERPHKSPLIRLEGSEASGVIAWLNERAAEREVAGDKEWAARLREAAAALTRLAAMIAEAEATIAAFKGAK